MKLIKEYGLNGFLKMFFAGFDSLLECWKREREKGDERTFDDFLLEAREAFETDGKSFVKKMLESK